VYLVIEGSEGRLAELLRVTRAYFVRGCARLIVIPVAGYRAAVSKRHIVLLDHGVVHFTLALFRFTRIDGRGTPEKDLDLDLAIERSYA